MKNEAIQTIILFLLISLFCSCDSSNLEGHWHLKRVDFNMKDSWSYYGAEAILDISDDVAYWNKLKYNNSGRELAIARSEKKLIGKAYDCLGGDEFNYFLVEDTLMLNGINRDKTYRGIRCDSSCCDKQADEFINFPVTIDLPYINYIGISSEYNIRKSLEQILCIGIPKDGIYTESVTPRISSYDRFIFPSDISEVVEKAKIKIPENWRGKLEFSLYVDKEVRMELVKSVVRQLVKSGISEVNFLVRGLEDGAGLNLRCFKIKSSLIEVQNDMRIVRDFVASIN